MAKPSALRIPVAKRSAGENVWFVLFASYRQMPPRVSSSVQGSAPGDLSVRFFSWQELVALATSTYIDPSGLMTNGCIGWSPPRGNPETMVSAEALGTMEPAGNEYRTMRSSTSAKMDPL